MLLPALLLLLSLGWASAPPVNGQADRPTPANLSDRAFTAAFNLDHDEAVRLARQLVAEKPDESRSHRLLATVLWTNMLFRMGAVTVDYFMGSLTKSKDTRPAVPPELEREFEAALDRAIELADARLDRNRHDLEARYDVGAAYAIQASFRASRDGSPTAAFGAARRAFNAQEDVLDADPDHLAANVIVGTYRYVVSTLRFPSRWLAYLVGFGGGKERGISMIESATRDAGSVVDAVPALLLIYTREERYDDALRMAERLADAFPRNRLFRLEVAAAALRAGQAERADEILTREIARLPEDTRPRVPGERALWLYKRAAARVELGRQADAHRDLDDALAGGPAGWIRGRIHLERGKLADLSGRRADAIEAYRTARDLAGTNQDPIARREADELIKRPFQPARLAPAIEEETREGAAP